MGRAQSFYEAYLQAQRNWDPRSYVPSVPLYNDGNGFRRPTDAEWFMVGCAIRMDSIASSAKYGLSRLHDETVTRLRSIETPLNG